MQMNSQLHYDSHLNDYLHSFLGSGLKTQVNSCHQKQMISVPSLIQTHALF